jgi:hypothetical protein
MNQQKGIKLVVRCLYAIVLLLVFMVMYPLVTFYILNLKPAENVVLPVEPAETSKNEVVDGVHTKTGLIADNGYELVVANCTVCHSSKLVTQNRATREGWESMIRWMQATQKLWDLGENEDIILDYLAKNYAPKATGRRAPLTDIEWYEQED